MTLCFSLLHMIPIDCKITIFPCTCLLTFLVTITKLVNSLAPLQKKEWPWILFLWVPHSLVNESKLCICICSPHYTAKKSMKSISFCLYMEIQKILSTCDSARPYNQLVTVNRWKGNYNSFSVLSKHFTERFKQKYSMINTSAISAVT